MVCIADRIPDSQQLLDGLLEGRDYTTITQRFSSRSSASAVSQRPRPLQAARLAQRCNLLRSRQTAPSCWTDATSSTRRFGGRGCGRWLVSAYAVDFQHTTPLLPLTSPVNGEGRGRDSNPYAETPKATMSSPPSYLSIGATASSRPKPRRGYLAAAPHERPVCCGTD